MDVNTEETTPEVKKAPKLNDPMASPAEPRDNLINILFNDVSDFHKFNNIFTYNSRLPEHDLLFSILELSIHEYIKFRKKYNNKNFLKRHRELYEWFFNTDMNKEHLCNFSNICDYLNINKNTILRQLRKMERD